MKSETRTLILMRHAKSSWSEPGLGDFDRPLNARGRAAAPLIGRQLRDAKLDVDVLLASTAVRVRETLELLLPAWMYEGPIVREKQLYLASPQTIMTFVSSLDSQWQSTMVVGHNPGMSELLSYLSDQSLEMPTAACAVLEGHGPDWSSALRSRPWNLVAYWKPRELE